MLDTASRQHQLRPQHDHSTLREHIEMDDSGMTRNSSRQRLLDDGDEANARGRLAGVAKHTLGLILLLCVVFLWTLSNFLGSSIFADNTYAKPFFLTYLNTSMFMLAMIPTLVRMGYRRHRDHGDLYMSVRSTFSTRGKYRRLQSNNDDTTGSEDAAAEEPEAQAFLGPDGKPLPVDTLRSQQEVDVDVGEKESQESLGIIPTARLSLMFCILWFGANYFAMACLQHTTVASTTILTSTSSFWTLVIGALTGTEKFTWRKLLGVLGSLVGIVLISQVDLSASADNGEGGFPSPSPSPQARARAVDTFPDKSPREMAFGDAMALLSAVIYGLYTITLKKTTIKALPRSLDMALFFGLVGLWNIVLLWPLFPILHFTGHEAFSLPPTRHIWTILLVNSVSSLFSDICWAYAMVLTSPLVVTVGLSLTIPLSLVGEMVLQGRYEGLVYWLGAAIVVGSFVFVDREEREEEECQPQPQPRSELPAGEEHATIGGVVRPEYDDIRGISHGSTPTERERGDTMAITQASPSRAAADVKSTMCGPAPPLPQGLDQAPAGGSTKGFWNRILSGGGGGNASSDDDDEDFLDSDSD
ncbi:hypothetical protein LTR99_004664 [Exophiala xenobiotica]|uniref:EamA domain-containing protein n=1 Tax=Vermiconidia calcicola TaxID=1690605 RepID=A0AAV9QFN8_9PEZI|nr:hypothetical protein LTR99_004664 [Exophiala xenobiotica]KAK5338817.1 hypothetical protein LTR98_005217 [Exophiala xenobiotica]KAK5432901.1 hypothetical protein LTR34_004374 [Exophiala xenobiotica]KAK5539945.1 hypothetical protein LTR25_003650 [Vermiconidia calcicola]